MAKPPLSLARGLPLLARDVGLIAACHTVVWEGPQGGGAVASCETV